MNKNFMNWGQYNTRHVIKHVTLKLWKIFVHEYSTRYLWNCDIRLVLYFYYNPLENSD